MYAFVKDHLLPVNAVLVLATLVAGALDFMRKTYPSLGLTVYVIATGLAVLVLVAGLVPVKHKDAAVGDTMERLGRRPGWRVVVTLMALITCMGWASYATAGQRGLLAEASPIVAGWQDALFSVQAGVNQVNESIDKVRKKLDTRTFAGDNCPTLDCAVAMGASEQTLRRFIDQGAKLPTEPAMFGSSINRLSKSRNEVRMDTLAVYLETRALSDINARAGRVAIHEPDQLKTIAAQLAPALRPRVSEIFMGRTACGLPSLRLTEIAALNGDKPLYDWLVARGADPSLPNQWCKNGPFAAPFTAAELMRAS